MRYIITFCLSCVATSLLLIAIWLIDEFFL